jgi:hypothetical protein
MSVLMRNISDTDVKNTYRTQWIENHSTSGIYRSHRREISNLATLDLEKSTAWTHYMPTAFQANDNDSL